MKILIFGKGYLGKRCATAWGDEAILSEVRITSVESALQEIDRVKPDAVLCTIGVKGTPNVDWCESHQRETIEGNVMVPLWVAFACQERGVYMLHMGSGCIFYGPSQHPDQAWRENDFGNPSATYSRTKWAADLALSTLPHVGIARIRMPIDHASNPGNLLEKLAKYPKVIDVENSITVIDDMVDVFYKLMEKKATGFFHVTNPGTIKHREILGLYKEMVDPSHACEWISNEELVAQGLATKGRSNNFLASERLSEFGITMRPVQEAVLDTVKKFAEKNSQG